jgi:ElaB/YqjD/DUF883 family membrane-anchored ribosome-binding protein
MNDSTNNTATTTTWADVWTVADAAARQTAADAADWVTENPKTAAATAVAVGVGIGYLLFG